MPHKSICYYLGSSINDECNGGWLLKNSLIGPNLVRAGVVLRVVFLLSGDS